VRSAFVIVGAALFMSACASVAQQDTAAVLVDPTDESRAELARVVRDALNTTEVTISSSALTRDSVLVIERTPIRDAAGRRLTGRDLDKPEQFRLVKTGTRCVLIRMSTAERYELKSARCAAK
jgi:hypothetical protein